mmetsp:Transcript_59729/g.159845  ORF Transcript_59729/g.159845 Transcript_59729/m.159845 type:complete len:229 (+) Transcript_59729:494-1180(+)
MTQDVVGLGLRRHQRLAQQGDVLVVPGIAVGNGGPVPDARDLVAVVPPGYNTGGGSCVRRQPVVGLTIIIKDDLLASLQPDLVHDRGVGEGVLRELPAVPLKAAPEAPRAEQHHRTHASSDVAPFLGLEEFQGLFDVVPVLGRFLLGWRRRRLALGLALLACLLGLRLGLRRFGLRHLVVRWLIVLQGCADLVEQPPDENPSRHRRWRPQNQHQPRHFAREIVGHRQV